MTPYDRMVVAIRHGVLVKRSKVMQFRADVRHYSTSPLNDDPFSVSPIEAGDEMEAARRVAEIAAVRRYEEAGCVGFLSQSNDGLFRASIGRQERSRDGIALHGVTISIHVWPLD